MAKETNSAVNGQTTVDQTVLITKPEKEAFVICEVCGHANSEKTAICKMCSNYLDGGYYGKKIR